MHLPIALEFLIFLLSLLSLLYRSETRSDHTIFLRLQRPKAGPSGGLNSDHLTPSSAQEQTSLVHSEEVLYLKYLKYPEVPCLLTINLKYFTLVIGGESG